jgi:hypothetical protein
MRDSARRPRRHLLEPQRRYALEQPRAGAERERHDVQPQLVDQAGGRYWLIVVAPPIWRHRRRRPPRVPAPAPTRCRR